MVLDIKSFRLNRMNKIISICLYLLLGLSVSAQKTSNLLTITVLDQSHRPLPGARVHLDPGDKIAYTDGNGEAVFSALEESHYTATVSFIGFTKTQQELEISTLEPHARMTIVLEEKRSTLHEVVVEAKSEARKLREQAMPVTVVSMRQLQGTVSDVNSILNKTVGIKIRNSGGVGSMSRISLRGLEGKRIGFFIDETPMGDQQDFVDINDIPVDMIDRVEIYKGVVPAKFGGSSMGGAVNIVLKEYPDKYADISYSPGSYNSHVAQLVFKRNHKPTGIIYGIGGGYTLSDNNYRMQLPAEKSKVVERDHDKYSKILFGGSFKVYKRWFDKVELEYAYTDTWRQIQGIETNIRSAESRARALAAVVKFEKENILTPGLDFTMNTSVLASNANLTDTARIAYDWNYKTRRTYSPSGGELNNYPSFSSNNKFNIINYLLLEYLPDKHNAFTLSSTFTLTNGKPSDDKREAAMGKKVLFPTYMRSHILGVSHDFHAWEDRFLNSLTLRHYYYGMDTQFTNIYNLEPPQDISLRKSSLGFSDAMRYRLTPSFMLKASGGYDVRIPSESELLGDGVTITPSDGLTPERNTSINLGVYYDITGIHPTNLQVEISGYYMYLEDMIRFVKGFLGAQYQNFGAMRTLGIEGEVKGDFLPWLYGYVNATFQDLRDRRKVTQGTEIPNPTFNYRMPNIPYLMANAGIELHRENLFGGSGMNSRLFLDGSFTEEYDYDFVVSEHMERKIPRAITLDLGFEQSFMNQRLFLSGKVSNLTNATLISEFNRPLPGRWFGAKMRYIFK